MPLSGGGGSPPPGQPTPCCPPLYKIRDRNEATPYGSTKEYWPCDASGPYRAQIAEPPLIGSDAPSPRTALLRRPTNVQSAASFTPPSSLIPRSKPRGGRRPSCDLRRDSRDQAPTCETMGCGRGRQVESPGRTRSDCSASRRSARPAINIGEKEGERSRHSAAKRSQAKGSSAGEGRHRGWTTPLADQSPERECSL